MNSVTLIYLTSWWLANIVVSDAQRNCVRLCYGGCAGTSTVYRRCIDLTFETTGCPFKDAVEFYAKNDGDCPPAGSSLSWGKTSKMNAWPNDVDNTRCPSGAMPQVWTNIGLFDSLGDCQSYVQNVESQSGWPLFRGYARPAPQLWESETSSGKTEQLTDKQDIMVLYSFAAYEENVAALKSWTCKECQKLPRPDDGVVFTTPTQEEDFFAAWNLQGFAVYCKSSDTVTVSFRGTVKSDPWNILLDFSVLKVRYLNYYVHSGFVTATTTVLGLKVLVDFVYKYRNSAFVLTGHSLGGAMATLAALTLKKAGYNVQEVFTFGAPRVGDSTFAAAYNVPIRRITFSRDPVPHVPPTAMGFAHTPSELFYSQDSKSTMCSSSCDGRSCCCQQYSTWECLWHMTDHSLYPSQVGKSRLSNFSFVRSKNSYPENPAPVSLFDGTSDLTTCLGPNASDIELLLLYKSFHDSPSSNPCSSQLDQTVHTNQLILA